MFTPQVSQRKQHSRLSVIGKACCTSEKQPGARGTWIGWESCWRCDKVTIGKDMVGFTRGTQPPIVAFELHNWETSEELPSKNSPTSRPQCHRTHPLISFLVDLCSKQVNSSSNPPSSPFYFMVCTKWGFQATIAFLRKTDYDFLINLCLVSPPKSADGRFCQSP